MALPNDDNVQFCGCTKEEGERAIAAIRSMTFDSDNPFFIVRGVRFVAYCEKTGTYFIGMPVLSGAQRGAYEALTDGLIERVQR